VWIERCTAGIEWIDPEYQLTGDSHAMEGIDRLKMRDQIDMPRSNNNRGSDV
jgi:hypothetical protein